MTGQKKRGLLIVLSGPSGVGKGTVAQRLLAGNPALRVSVSWTTRTMRPGDVEGVTYFFKTDGEFMAMAEKDGFLEYAGIYGKRYGTPREYVESILSQGLDCLLEIDPQGAVEIMNKMPEALSIYLLPPSLEVLKARLIGRGTETPEQAQKRFEAAEKEMAYAPRYRYQVVNDDLDRTVKTVQSIIQQAKE